MVMIVLMIPLVEIFVFFFFLAQHSYCSLMVCLN